MRPDKSLSPFEIRLYRHYRLVHGVRIALAFTLTFLLVRLLNVPEGTWPLITLVVVMGPISFWGNVVPRAFERIGGTIFGASVGLIALKLELISLPIMLLWCALAMFICGYLTLGKRPYQALLIGITLSVVVGAPAGDLQIALWRSGDVILGSLLAMLFTSIYPQRAFIHWRIQMATFAHTFTRLSQAGFSPNLVERPRLDKSLHAMLSDVVKMRALIVPASKETHIQKSVFEAIQTVSRNLVCTLELQLNAHWATRESHFVMINAHTLRETQQMTHHTLAALSKALYEGNPSPVAANNARLAEIVGELRQMMHQDEGSALHETSIHGYVWLSLELARQLELLSNLICRALRK
ncbi:FUSC family protein [Atlantibacter subterranea]|uniref:FUSC family protein n=1 Tax=Atlantibacter subterraneus TaxID=255519 RepID=A0A3R9F624_9ENTR|nr:FUSC family protein [Atlantibacter subterranea]QFH72119.1 FUSC family protein [Enterobacter sp. E76]MDA3133940.1 FUSC family protein [Atlantibacter subterranea]MDW2741419.1 FUSC family protein [Atlantibacter subterranea]RSB64531.1 FUSC family protein [Atlantibacter subterranea]RSE07680.1 FUSC family protein [Atlantibacter subterranea]